MPKSPQNLDHPTGDAHRPLARLVDVGVAAQVDRSAAIGRLGQLLLQQPRRLRLEEQLGFEIQAGRQPHVGVGGPGVAIDAPMLAAAIGVDRAVEADVRAVVAADDRAGALRRQAGLELGRRIVLVTPPVVESLHRRRLESPDRLVCAPRLSGRARMERRRWASDDTNRPLRTKQEHACTDGAVSQAGVDFSHRSMHLPSRLALQHGDAGAPAA